VARRVDGGGRRGRRCRDWERPSNRPHGPQSGLGRGRRPNSRGSGGHRDGRRRARGGRRGLAHGRSSRDAHVGGRAGAMHAMHVDRRCWRGDVTSLRRDVFLHQRELNCRCKVSRRYDNS
jgi:hypothetical protein